MANTEVGILPRIRSPGGLPTAHGGGLHYGDELSLRRTPAGENSHLCVRHLPNFILHQLIWRINSWVGELGRSGDGFAAAWRGEPSEGIER